MYSSCSTAVKSGGPCTFGPPLPENEGVGSGPQDSHRIATDVVMTVCLVMHAVLVSFWCTCCARVYAIPAPDSSRQVRSLLSLRTTRILCSMTRRRTRYSASLGCVSCAFVMTRARYYRLSVASAPTATTITPLITRTPNRTVPQLYSTHSSA